MAIEDDFTIDYTNKRIYHSANNNTYTVNQLYSWLQDTFDELTQMDDPVPMSAQTPNAYTMENGWFIDDETIKYLDDGAIETNGYLDEIRVLTFGTTYTNCVASDIGKQVLGSSTGDTGILLFYDNTRKKWWVRMDDSGDLFDEAETVTVQSGGTGTGTTRGASITGEELYTNIYTLGTISTDPYPEVYIEQRDPDGVVQTVVNARNSNDWWDRGQIDILVKVKEGGVELNNAIIVVHARHYGDLFDNFQIDLTAGGRNAVPLATATDLDNATPEAYMLYDSETANFHEDYILTGGTSGATAEIVSLTDWGTEGVIGLGNIIGTFQDNETITDNYPSTPGSATSNGNATLNEATGELYLVYDQESGGPFTVNEVIKGLTTNASGTLIGLQDDGTTGKMVIRNPSDTFQVTPSEEQIQGQSSSATAYIDTTTLYGVRAYEDFDDILIYFMNGTLPYDTQGGNFTQWSTVEGEQSGATGIILYDDDQGATGTLYLGNVTGSFQDNEGIFDLSTGTALVNSSNGLVVGHTINEAFEQQSGYPYDAIVECGGRYVSEVYEYLKLASRQETDLEFYTFESEMRRVQFGTPYTNAVEADIGRTASGGTSGHLGVITGYNNTNKTWDVWVDDQTSDWFDEVETVSAVGGTGTGTTTGASSILPQEGEYYKGAYDAYAAKKSAPFGTFAGGKFFGAQGIWLENMHADDVQAYSLIDSNGVTRDPPNKQPITVTDLQSGDRVSVFRTSGGVIDKAMYTSHNTNNSAGDSTFEVTTSIDTDTPSGAAPNEGALRIVDDSENTEHRMRYASWTGSIFTLLTKISGNTTSGGGSTQINDSGASFLSENIRTGDICRNSTTGDWAQVVSVDSNILITTTPLQGGGDNNWDSGDGYEFHTLPVTYDSNDTAYVPYIDRQADSDSEAVTVIFTATRNILARVRKKGIIPFEISSTFVSTGRSIAAIRTTDNIVS